MNIERYPWDHGTTPRWRICAAAAAGAFGNAPRAGEIETWLRELDFDVVTIEHSGAVEFFEAKLNTKGTHS